MGHGLIAAFSAVLLVPASGWILVQDDFESLPVVYNGVYSFTNSGSETVQHSVGGQDTRSQTVYGSAYAGTPVESGPTWTAKFTPLSAGPLVTNWEVHWTVQPGYTWYVNMFYNHEVGDQAWYRSSHGTVARSRSWHIFDRQTSTFTGPGSGGQGGGG